MYFRTPLNKEMTRATVFSEKYLYFHSPSMTNNPASDIKTLGKFITISRQNSGSLYDNYDYSMYEFELGTVKCKQNGEPDGEIYLIGIPDSDEEMILIDTILYWGWPVFFTL
jgi:hypothetical protein